MECCYMPRSPCSRTINAFFMKEKKKTLYSVVQKIFTETLLLFSHSVMSDFLRPYGLHHARLPCPSLSPRICSNSCPLSHQWMPSTILSSVIPLHTTFVKSYRVSWCGNRGALLTSYTHVHTQHSTCP